ncbi:MAG: 30S ribosomal protein S20 [Proteobacteria bacterium]|nr:30S ribosomal protein S20 [Pseudomonadota bacterium]
MAHCASARKRIRQEAKRRIENRSYLSALRTSLKSLRLGIEATREGKMKAEDLMKLLAHSQSFLMRSVSKGRIKKNNASRRIKRLAAQVKAACLNPVDSNN